MYSLGHTKLIPWSSDSTFMDSLARLKTKIEIKVIVRPMKSNKGANYRVGCTPLGTKVPIYHFKAESMLNTIHNVVKLKTCAVSS